MQDDLTNHCMHSSVRNGIPESRGRNEVLDDGLTPALGVGLTPPFLHREIGVHAL